MTKPLEQRLHDGSRAKEVLENEAFTASFSAIEQEILERWTNSPARDAEGREKLWTMLQLLKKVKACLQTTLETGILAQKELEHQRSLAARLRGLTSWNE